jgi:hypothetical protein
VPVARKGQVHSALAQAAKGDDPVSYCRLLIGLALLSLGCAAAGEVDPDDPCCLTYNQIKELFKDSACIDADDVPQCLIDSARLEPEKGIQPDRATKYLFIKDKTIGISPQAKKTGKGEIVIDFRMVEKSDKKIRLVFNGETYKLKETKEFTKQLKVGDLTILPMKFTKKENTCRMIGVFALRPKKKAD